jgi:hypothetical protein
MVTARNFKVIPDRFNVTDDDDDDDDDDEKSRFIKDTFYYGHLIGSYNAKFSHNSCHFSIICVSDVLSLNFDPSNVFSTIKHSTCRRCIPLPWANTSLI